jgi:hypothetical protein
MNGLLDKLMEMFKKKQPQVPIMGEPMYSDTPGRYIDNWMKQKEDLIQPESAYTRHLTRKGMFIDPTRDFQQLRDGELGDNQGLLGFKGQRDFSGTDPRHLGGLWQNPQQAMGLLKLLEQLEIQRQQEELQERRKAMGPMTM